MTNDHTILLDRRGFLKSAALLAGASALELPFARPASAATGQSLTTMSYWYNHNFVDPGTLPSGDASLSHSGANVLIHSHSIPDGAEPLLNGCVAVFSVPNGSQTEFLPFYAWTTSTVNRTSNFFMPVAPASGLMLSIETTSAQSPAESYYLAVGSAAQTAKLHTGTYLIAAGSPNYTGCSLKTVNGEAVVVGPDNAATDFEYLLLTITEG